MIVLIRPPVGCRDRDGRDSQGIHREACEIAFDDVVNGAVPRRPGEFAPCLYQDVRIDDSDGHAVNAVRAVRQEPASGHVEPCVLDRTAEGHADPRRFWRSYWWLRARRCLRSDREVSCKCRRASQPRQAGAIDRDAIRARVIDRQDPV